MAKPPFREDNDSLDPKKGFGIGQLADGKLDIFPLDELPAREAERDRQEAETDYAVAQSEAGFPDLEEDLDDISDLDE